MNAPADIQLAQDEAVIKAAEVAMRDPEAVTAAIYRLTTSPHFIARISDLVEGRRERSVDLANRAASHILWEVEEEIINHIRRGMK